MLTPSHCDLKSKESVTSALMGAHAAFLSADTWTIGSLDEEVAQGKLVTDIAKETGLQRLIYCSQNSATDLSGGKLRNMIHFDGKNEVEQYIRASGIPTTTFVLPGIPMTRFMGDIKPGVIYNFGVPVRGTAQLPLLDAKDMGM